MGYGVGDLFRASGLSDGIVDGVAEATGLSRGQTRRALNEGARTIQEEREARREEQARENATSQHTSQQLDSLTFDRVYGGELDVYDVAGNRTGEELDADALRRLQPLTFDPQTQLLGMQSPEGELYYVQTDNMIWREGSRRVPANEVKQIFDQSLPSTAELEAARAAAQAQQAAVNAEIPEPPQATVAEPAPEAPGQDGQPLDIRPAPPPPEPPQATVVEPAPEAPAQDGQPLDIRPAPPPPEPPQATVAEPAPEAPEPAFVPLPDEPQAAPQENDIMRAQQLMSDMGMYDGPINGENNTAFLNNVVNAKMEASQEVGARLPLDGFVTPEFVQALEQLQQQRAEQEVVVETTVETTVEAPYPSLIDGLQSQLSQLGFAVGEQGQWDAQTQDAFQQYVQARQLDGISPNSPELHDDLASMVELQSAYNVDVAATERWTVNEVNTLQAAHEQVNDVHALNVPDEHKDQIQAIAQQMASAMSFDGDQSMGEDVSSAGVAMSEVAQQAQQAAGR